ncbi:hypothetical protein NGB36_28035 [Streptomyces sp. RB6PN25]|uniref:Uncharacterized protein n=1 Tax=Streptomyces humicola TaxID=2953240 RepID=A0ABT1Q329_9ACTN|nr:hypothetical protein [Streptomyces humicola]MCQ4084326.1 hypothetical protein [Streptomyces humicola]
MERSDDPTESIGREAQALAEAVSRMGGHATADLSDIIVTEIIDEG